jgi:hypothetical protein
MIIQFGVFVNSAECLTKYTLFFPIFFLGDGRLELKKN